MRKNKSIKKQEWLNPEMIKIKLNPEQAVLSCCDLSERAAVVISPSRQCMGMTCRATLSVLDWDAVSS